MPATQEPQQSQQTQQSPRAQGGGGQQSLRGGRTTAPASGGMVADQAAVSPNCQLPQKYTVQRGDSFWTIAEKTLGTGTSWIKVWTANRDQVPSKHALRPGMVLTIPPRADVEQCDPEAGEGRSETYVVRRGDNLQKIAAARLGDADRWQELWKWNEHEVPNPSFLRVGQKIWLGPDRPAPFAPRPQPRPDDVDTGGGGQQDQEPAPQQTQTTYEVRPGDNLSLIAKKALGDSGRWRDIWDWNRGQLPNPNALRVGMVLRVDGAAPQRPAPTEHDQAGPQDGGQHGPQGQLATGNTPLERNIADLYNSKGKLILSEAARLGIEPEVALAVMNTESGGKGFRNGKLVIRFEAHIFRDLTNQRVWVRHTGRQADEYDAFQRARAVDNEAAHDSISMGSSQIMGFNAERIGYSSATEMFEDFMQRESAHVKGFFEFVRTSRGLLNAAKNKKWATFARLYNGPDYARNAYDTKMAAAYGAARKVLARLNG